MTTAQRSELDQAIERAQRNGIHIIGRGTLKASGVKYFMTTGRTAQKNHDHGLHYVRVEGMRLVCDCPARVICTHRAVCHVELAREHAATKAVQRHQEQTAAAREQYWQSYWNERGC